MPLGRQMFPLLAICAAHWLGVSDARAGGSAEYRIGPQDRLRINISEWSAGSGELRSRVSSDIAVDPEGRLAIPVMGNIPASGLTATELAKVIGREYQAKARALNPPVTSVEIIQHRPFYILGYVERPGEYPFRPGMTTLHALSVAGGLARRAGLDAPRAARDAIQARGDVELHRNQYLKLLARKARLEAAIAGRKTIEPPPLRKPNVSAAELKPFLAREQVFLTSSADVLTQEVAKLKDVRRLLNEQVVSLRSQVEGQVKQEESINHEMQLARQLESKGLSTSSRLFNIERALIAVESKKREIDHDALRVRQMLIETDAAIRRAEEPKRVEWLAELTTVNAEVDEAAEKMATAERLVREADFSDEAGAQPEASEPAVIYTVIRPSADPAAEVRISEVTPLEPGDIVRVARIQQPRRRQVSGTE